MTSSSESSDLRKALDPHTDPAAAVPGVGMLRNKVEKTISTVGGRSLRGTQLRVIRGQQGLLQGSERTHSVSPAHIATLEDRGAKGIAQAS